MKIFRLCFVQVILVLGYVVIDIIAVFKKLTIFVLLSFVFFYYIFKSEK